MLQILDARDASVLGFRLSGELTHEDYEEMLPLLARQIEREGGVRAVMDIRDVTGVSARALADEVKFDVQHARDIDRCAVVGDERWQESVTRLASPVFGRGHVAFFRPDRIDEAWEFAAGRSRGAGDAEPPLLTNPAAVGHLAKLIRGEISAIETYVQALDKVEEPAASQALDVLKKNHIDATNTLREQVHALGGQPPTDSGPWGTFAKAVEGAAKLLGNVAALRALREGEELGVRLYEEALTDERLPGETRRLVREKLLPRQKTHVEAVKQLARSM